MLPWLISAGLPSVPFGFGFPFTFTDSSGSKVQCCSGSACSYAIAASRSICRGSIRLPTFWPILVSRPTISDT